MDIPGGREPQAASELRTEVADDVAKKIASHDDIELPGIADDFHGQGINIEVTRLDFGIFLAYLLVDPLPEIVGKGHGVGFIAHANAPQIIAASVIKRVTDDTLDALP